MPKRTCSQETPWGSGLANQSKNRAVQLRRKRHSDQQVAMPDSSSSGKGGPCLLQRIVMDNHSPSHVDSLAYWFVINMKFLVDDAIVVVVAEDDATDGLITDVSMVQ